MYCTTSIGYQPNSDYQMFRIISHHIYHIRLTRTGRVLLSVNVETTDQHFHPDVSTAVNDRL
jgi:hypothetical protein